MKQRRASSLVHAQVSDSDGNVKTSLSSLVFLGLQLMLLSLCGRLVVGCPCDPALPDQGVTCPVLTAGARRRASFLWNTL